MLASHPLMKLVYWDDAIIRQPDPMHTTGNELKALAVMLMGGTGKAPAYSTPRLPQLAEHECNVNERWQDILEEFLPAGELYLHPCHCHSGLRCHIANEHCEQKPLLANPTHKPLNGSTHNKLCAGRSVGM